VGLPGEEISIFKG